MDRALLSRRPYAAVCDARTIRVKHAGNREGCRRKTSRAIPKRPVATLKLRIPAHSLRDTAGMAGRRIVKREAPDQERPRMMILPAFRARPGRRAPKLLLTPAVLALALLASGCDKCGDYFWQNGSKTCHDESQVK